MSVYSAYLPPVPRNFVALHPVAVSLVAAWNQRDVAALTALYTSDCMIADVGLASPVYGHEGVRRMFLFTVSGFGQLVFTLHRTVSDGESVTMDWTAVGVQSRRMLGIPPTGRTVHIEGMTVLMLRDGLIAHTRRVWDMAGLLRQIGLLPDLPDLSKEALPA
jgi:steroid delta-isomerase-like uncharacterized protein